MRAYLQSAVASLKRQVAYKAASLAGMITNLFWGFFRAYLFLAVLGQKGEVAGYNRQQLLLYVALTQAVIPVLGVFGWWDLTKAVRTGEIILDYCKPVHLYGMWLARDAGRSAYAVAFRAVPLMVAFLLLFGVNPPRAPLTWAAFALSIVLAWLLSFSWRIIYNSVAFWTVDAVGIGSVLNSLGWLLMGFIIPVSFFPPWLKKLAIWTPFPSMLNAPNEIILGVTKGPGVYRSLAVQAAWAVAMILAAGRIARKGLKRVVIQGG